MSKKAPLLLLFGLLLAPVGCQAVYSPAVGVFYADVNFPSGVTANAGSSKKASGDAISLFGLLALGDVSIEHLAKQEGITKIHHVDTHVQNILGVGKMTVTVYGE